MLNNLQFYTINIDNTLFLIDAEEAKICFL